MKIYLLLSALTFARDQIALVEMLDKQNILGNNKTCVKYLYIKRERSQYSEPPHAVPTTESIQIFSQK